MLNNILFFVFGALLSWLFTHVYYKKSSRDAMTLYNKLSKDSRDLILESKNSSLTVKDLNTLLKNRVLDEKTNEFFKHRVCPVCGSTNLERNVDHLVDAEPGDGGLPIYSAIEYPTIECLDCGWKKSGIDDDAEKLI